MTASLRFLMRWQAMPSGPRFARQSGLEDDRMARVIHTKEAVVTYLIVGLDLRTHAPWHENVSADAIATARRIARTRAAEQGIDLVVAAVIGPNSAVALGPDGEWATGLKAA